MIKETKCIFCLHLNNSSRITCQKCYKPLRALKPHVGKRSKGNLININWQPAAVALSFGIVVLFCLFKAIGGYGKYNQNDSLPLTLEQTFIADQGPSEPGFPAEKEISEIVKISDISKLLSGKLSQRGYITEKYSTCDLAHPATDPYGGSIKYHGRSREYVHELNPEGHYSGETGPSKEDLEKYQQRLEKNLKCKEKVKSELSKHDKTIFCFCGKYPGTDNKKLFESLGFTDFERYKKTQMVQDLKTENGVKVFRRITRCRCESYFQKSEDATFLIELKSERGNWKYSARTRIISSDELNMR